MGPWNRRETEARQTLLSDHRTFPQTDGAAGMALKPQTKTSKYKQAPQASLIKPCHKSSVSSKLVR